MCRIRAANLSLSHSRAARATPSVPFRFLHKQTSNAWIRRVPLPTPLTTNFLPHHTRLPCSSWVGRNSRRLVRNKSVEAYPHLDRVFRFVFPGLPIRFGREFACGCACEVVRLSGPSDRSQNAHTAFFFLCGLGLIVSQLWVVSFSLVWDLIPPLEF